MITKARRIKIVCCGGGTGMPSLLSGLKHNPWFEVTAVVNMFDTGGSSGELKDKFGILPPGDVLRCLLALSEDEAGARKILLKRIDHPSFSGHTGGNLLLMAFEKVYGNHLDAVNSLAQVLSVKGRVVPVTSLQGTLCASYADKTIKKGETNIDKYLFAGNEISNLFIEPEVRASRLSIKAVKEAEILCVGPGSFYTSILPNFLPGGIKDEIKKSKTPIIFIGNLLTEGLGMKKYKVETVVKILEKYLGRKVSAIVVNNRYPLKLNGAEDRRVVSAGLWSDTNIARHDSNLLANLVSSVIHKLID